MDVEESDSDSELFVRSAYPPVQLPLDYEQHQKKHRMGTHDVKVVTPNTKVVTPNTKVVTPNTKVVTPNTKVVTEVTEVKPDTLMMERKTSDTFSSSGDRSPPVLVKSLNTSPSYLSASEVTVAQVFSHLDDPRAHMVLFQLPDTLPFAPGDQTEEGGEGAAEGISEEVRPHRLLVVWHPIVMM